jgi:hypothetical protein
MQTGKRLSSNYLALMTLKDYRGFLPLLRGKYLLRFSLAAGGWKLSLSRYRLIPTGMSAVQIKRNLTADPDQIVDASARSGHVSFALTAEDTLEP